MGDGFDEGISTARVELNRAQRILDRELGEKGLAEYYGEPDKIAATVLSLGRQRAWEAYRDATPNLGETEVRRVGRHIGFDEAWELFAPLLEAQIDLTNGAEARLDFLEQYRDMLRRSGDSPWDPQLVANDLTHVLEADIFELPGRDEELEPRIAAVQPAEPKRTSREDQVAAAAEQVRDDAERGIATAQWIKDLAATYDRPVATIELKMAAKKMTEEKSDFEYGWRSFFEGTDEEYEWLACRTREEAEALIKRYQDEEDEFILNSPGSTGLTYSLWRRAKGNSGPWIAVDPSESK